LIREIPRESLKEKCSERRKGIPRKQAGTVEGHPSKTSRANRGRAPIEKKLDEPWKGTASAVPLEFEQMQGFSP
jgi:hypothetical protein